MFAGHTKQRSLRCSRRSLLWGGLLLSGGVSSSLLSGCSSGSGCVSGRGVPIPKRSRAIPSIVEGGEFILADTGRYESTRFFLGSSRPTETAPALLAPNGQVGVAEAYSNSDACGATILYEPQIWETNVAGRGGSITTLGRNIGSLVPVLVNGSNAIVAVEVVNVAINRLVLLTGSPTVPPGLWTRRELPILTFPLDQENDYQDLFITDITGEGRVLVNTRSRVFAFTQNTLDVLPDLTNDRNETTLPSLRFTGTTLLDDGTVIGYSQRRITENGYDPIAEASYLFQNNTYNDIGTPDGYRNVKAIHANSSGQIVGTLRPLFTENTLSFLWENGGFTLIGIDGFRPRAISDDGTIAGSLNNRATLLKGSTVRDLNTFIGSGSGWELLDALSINSVGQVLVEAKHPEDEFKRLVVLTPASPALTI